VVVRTPSRRVPAVFGAVTRNGAERGRAQLESLLRRLHAAAQDESDPGPARFLAQFRAELQALIFEYGPKSVHAALDGLLDVASRSVSFDLLPGTAPARESHNPLRLAVLALCRGPSPKRGTQWGIQRLGPHGQTFEIPTR
jgi:hypothetical protein